MIDYPQEIPDNKRDISQLKNREREKICHVIGHGPSLSNHLEYLSNLDQNNIIVSINEVDAFTNLKPDYWLTSNPMYTVDKIYDRINKFPETKFIYSDVTDTTPTEIVESLLKVEYFTFDWLHFESRPNSFSVKGKEFGCNNAWIPCCSQIKNRLTIQELLMTISENDFHYSTADTNIIHALALAVILGPKIINIYGVDLDYKKGYVGGHQTNGSGATHGDSFDFWMDRIQSDFYIIKESANLLGISINYYGDSEVLKKIFIENQTNQSV